MAYTEKLDKQGLDFSCKWRLPHIITLSRARHQSMRLSNIRVLIRNTDGAFMCYGLCQAEISVYIVAQTVPLLRVLSFKKKKTAGSETATQVASVAELNPHPQGKARATTTTMISERQPSIELVQLPGGKIVAADSEEGRQFQASQPRVAETSGTAAAAMTPRLDQEAETVTPARRHSANTGIEDEVHRLWADMYVYFPDPDELQISPPPSPLPFAAHPLEVLSWSWLTEYALGVCRDTLGRCLQRWRHSKTHTGVRFLQGLILWALHDGTLLMHRREYSIQPNVKGRQRHYECDQSCI